MEKASFVRKIECPSPDHVDSHPSCALYSDGSAYCFACCTYFKEVEGFQETFKKVEKEDLEQTLAYINSLPVKEIRGLSLPADNSGYFIVWPDNDFYKFRQTDSLSTEGNKYIGTRGWTKPVFVIPNRDGAIVDTCLVVEGEINALSLSKITRTVDIISPGGAGNFTDRTMLDQLHKLIYYDNVIICVDADSAGLLAALKLKKAIYASPEASCMVGIVLLEKDFNQLLVEYGENFKDKVKEELEKVGMSVRL